MMQVLPTRPFISLHLTENVTVGVNELHPASEMLSAIIKYFMFISVVSLLLLPCHFIALALCLLPELDVLAVRVWLHLVCTMRSLTFTFSAHSHLS